MKLRPNSTPIPISKHETVHKSEVTRLDIYEHYEHPWYKFNRSEKTKAELIKPNPPSKEAVERARFVDKTYKWTGSNPGIRHGDKRSSK